MDAVPIQTVYKIQVITMGHVALGCLLSCLRVFNYPHIFVRFPTRLDWKRSICPRPPFFEKYLHFLERYWVDLCLTLIYRPTADFCKQTCSLHAGEEGVILIGGRLHWTECVKTPLQKVNVTIISSSGQDAFSGLDHFCSCYKEHKNY